MARRTSVSCWGACGRCQRSVIELLKLSRAQLEFFATIQKRLVKGLRADAGLRQRVQRLQSIRGVGEILALTWALEIGEVQRFPSIAEAVSYCGLTSAQHNSAGQEHRGPISKAGLKQFHGDGPAPGLLDSS